MNRDGEGGGGARAAVKNRNVFPDSRLKGRMSRKLLESRKRCSGVSGNKNKGQKNKRSRKADADWSRFCCCHRNRLSRVGGGGGATGADAGGGNRKDEKANRR